MLSQIFCLRSICRDDEPLRADQPLKAFTFMVSAHAAGIPNDTLFQQNKLWGLKNDDHPGIDIHANEAWNLSTGSRDIVVGVIDTGIYYDHPDLLANMWRAPREFDVTLGDDVIHCLDGSHGYNAVAGTCDPVDGTTNFGHGTHVSGII